MSEREQRMITRARCLFDFALLFLTLLLVFSSSGRPASEHLFCSFRKCTVVSDCGPLVVSCFDAPLLLFSTLDFFCCPSSSCVLNGRPRLEAPSCTVPRRRWAVHGVVRPPTTRPDQSFRTPHLSRAVGGLVLVVDGDVGRSCPAVAASVTRT